MGYDSASFDPALVATNSDAASSALAEANIASAAAATVSGAFATHSTAADPHGGYTLESLFNANTILAANLDNTPTALAIVEQRIVGRITSGNIAALTGAQALTILSGQAGAAFDFNSQNLTGVGTIGCGTITTTGDFVLPSAGWLGLAVDKGRLVFTDAATDTAVFMGCKVGIGGVPVKELDVQGEIRAGGTVVGNIYLYDADSNLRAQIAGGTGNTYFGAGGGFVGIQATNPLSELEVDGRIITGSVGTEPASGAHLEMFYYSGDGYIYAYDRTAGHYDKLVLGGMITTDQASGNVSIANLAGVGNRAVIADANGVLSAP